MKKIIFITILISLIFSESVFAKSERIIDNANIFSSYEERKIENVLDQFYEQTNVDYVICTVETSAPEIDKIAINEFHKLKLGGDNEDNGMLLYIAKENKQTGLAIGKNLQKIFNDNDSQKIMNSLNPYFQKGQYFNGITASNNYIIEKMNHSGYNISIKELNKRKLLYLVLILAFGMMFVILKFYQKHYKTKNINVKD